MSILEDGVFSSISYHGKGMFRFDRISYENKMLLKGIKERQRRKFKGRKLIPKQVLQVLWSLGYLPDEKRPQGGMRVKIFLGFLRHGKYRNKKNHALGVWLHDKIEQEECQSDDITLEIFIKCGRGKFMPVSILREEPGTIFR